MIQETCGIYEKTLRTSETISAWKASLRKKLVVRLEKMSACKHTLTLDKVNRVLSCLEMWRDIVKSLTKWLSVHNQELNLCTHMIATLFIFRSWQRPGAVLNAATLLIYRSWQRPGAVLNAATLLIYRSWQRPGAVLNATTLLIFRSWQRVLNTGTWPISRSWQRPPSPPSLPLLPHLTWSWQKGSTAATTSPRMGVICFSHPSPTADMAISAAWR